MRGIPLAVRLPSSGFSNPSNPRQCCTLSGVPADPRRELWPPPRRTGSLVLLMRGGHSAGRSRFQRPFLLFRAGFYFLVERPSITVWHPLSVYYHNSTSTVPDLHIGQMPPLATIPEKRVFAEKRSGVASSGRGRHPCSETAAGQAAGLPVSRRHRFRLLYRPRREWGRDRGGLEVGKSERRVRSEPGGHGPRVPPAASATGHFLPPARIAGPVTGPARSRPASPASSPGSRRRSWPR